MNITYETDFCAWLKLQSKLLKQKEYEKLDIENLIEEIEDLGKSERRMLESHLENLLMHMLKVKYQPEKHTKSWDATIKEATFKANKVLSENPSLKSNIKQMFFDAYFSARLKAVTETNLDECIFPEECPWNLKNIFPNLENKYLNDD